MQTARDDTMILSIDLPPSLDQSLADAAARDGVSPSEQATFLLLLASALTGKAANTLFRSAVREFLEQNAIDADRVAEVCDKLMTFCLEHNIGPASSMSGEAGPMSSLEPKSMTRTRFLLRQWRTSNVHQSVADDNHASPTRFAPKEILEQNHNGSQRISLRGKYAWLKTSSDDFAREKQEEIDREDRR